MIEVILRMSAALLMLGMLTWVVCDPEVLLRDEGEAPRE